MLGEHLPIPAIGPGWDPNERWSELFRWKWQEEEHINVLEARALLAAVRRALRNRGAWGRRLLLFVDSQVTLCCVSKGRSSRPALTYVCRRVAALGLACESTPVVRWVPTKRNHADGPSRGFGLGVAPEADCPPRVRLPAGPPLLPEDFRRISG